MLKQYVIILLVMPKSNANSQLEEIKSNGAETEAPPENLTNKAKLVLKKNDQGTFTIPAQGIYPHQWLWDSCFISIGMRHYDLERAKLEIFSILKGQWSNGWSRTW